jgi:putative hydrolase of HD superfamily
MNNYSRLINLFFEVGSLRKIARSHRQILLTDDISDNIASHSFRVAIIAYFLAQLEKVDVNKTIIMALFHDLSETRSGDQNWVHKRYVKVFEDEIIKDQLSDLTENNQLLAIMREYHERKTPESKVAKDADLLDQILLLKEYALNGNKEAETWLQRKEPQKRLQTQSAKKLAKKLYKTNPHNWWGNLWTSKRR